MCFLPKVRWIYNRACLKGSCQSLCFQLPALSFSIIFYFSLFGCFFFFVLLIMRKPLTVWVILWLVSSCWGPLRILNNNHELGKQPFHSAATSDYRGAAQQRHMRQMVQERTHSRSRLSWQGNQKFLKWKADPEQQFPCCSMIIFSQPGKNIWISFLWVTLSGRDKTDRVFCHSVVSNRDVVLTCWSAEFSRCWIT